MAGLRLVQAVLELTGVLQIRRRAIDVIEGELRGILAEKFGGKPGGRNS